MRVAFRMLSAVAMLVVSFGVAAQTITIPPQPVGTKSSGVYAGFPAQNINGPTDGAFQTNYPYEGQCVTAANQTLFPKLPQCTTGNAPSFACPSGITAASPSWAGYAACGSVTSFKELGFLLPNPAIKFQWEVLNPPDYKPDTLTYPGADYYEIGVHEAWGFDGLAKAGAFPNPGVTVPNGTQWVGLKDAAGKPLFTPIWGVGQINQGGGPVTQLLSSLGLFAPGTASAWSANNYVATWPSISIRATRNRPVVVKWTNEFPNNHVFCPHPEAADWPCAIDRTFMGVKSKIDPALATANVPAEGVNAYGSPQQPDNSWVTHLHGGDIPPQTDGFAEKWFGNRVTAALWNGVSGNYVSPPFENPSKIMMQRPATYFDTYTYPIQQEEATIWFHDHTLGKTHHNVIAGPAGFFPVLDAAQHSDPGTLQASLSNLGNNYTCTQGGVAGKACAYGWLDILSYPRDAIGRPLYDYFLAVQDRAFNTDGSINFANGMGQWPLPAGTVIPAGYTSITNGVNPMVHPTWVPEYFGDHALVNGVAWPKATVKSGWYRLRLVDGSDSRCWTIGFQSGVVPAPGAAVTPNVPFYVLANDQGYLRSPVLAPATGVTMCPGERYELLVDFTAFAGQTVSMTNSAAAPFPAGITPFTKGSPFADMNVVMTFNVGTAAGIRTCNRNNATNCLMPVGQFIDPAWKDIRVQPAGTVYRQVYLNERVDGVTLAPMGMQLNGVPFEYKVTETPKQGTVEYWQFINLTVDAHPMHPHLVKHQIVQRQNFNVGAYKALLCGSTTCQPGPVPGNEMQVVPDVTPLLQQAPIPVTAASVEGGWKDATQAPPGMVTTIVAKWQGGWAPVAAGLPAGAPGVGGPDAAACNPAGITTCDPITLVCTTAPQPATCKASSFSYLDATTGPYVWHCHINSHEDSEMMHSSLVVK